MTQAIPDIFLGWGVYEAWTHSIITRPKLATYASLFSSWETRENRYIWLSSYLLRTCINTVFLMSWHLFKCSFRGKKNKTHNSRDLSLRPTARLRLCQTKPKWPIKGSTCICIWPPPQESPKSIPSRVQTVEPRERVVQLWVLWEGQAPTLRSPELTQHNASS